MSEPRIVEKVIILKPIKPNFCTGNIYAVRKLEEYFKPKFIEYLINTHQIKRL